MMRFAILLFPALLLCAQHARADLEVFTKRDTIVLEDGSEIACRVLMISEKGVLIVEADPANPEKKSQRIIPREKIRSIIRDERNGAIEGLSTDTEFARKVIKGTHKDEPKEEVADEKPGKKSSGRPKTPFEESTKTAPGPFAQTKDTTNPAGAGPTAPAGGKDVKVEMPKGTLNAKDLTDAYFTRYPELRGAGMDLLGTTQIQEWLNSARDGNDSARKPIESMLKAYMGVNDKSGSAAPQRTGEPREPRLRKVTPKTPEPQGE